MQAAIAHADDRFLTLAQGSDGESAIVSGLGVIGVSQQRLEQITTYASSPALVGEGVPETVKV